MAAGNRPEPIATTTVADFRDSLQQLVTRFKATGAPEEMQQKLSSLLAQVDSMPLEEIAKVAKVLEHNLKEILSNESRSGGSRSGGGFGGGPGGSGGERGDGKTDFQKTGESWELSSNTLEKDKRWHDLPRLHITRIDAAGLQVNQVALQGSVFLHSNFALLWKPTKWSEITIPSLSLVSVLYPVPEMLLIGSGEQSQLLPRRLQTYLGSLGISWEVLPTRQVAHTYNLLVEEDRNVCAAVLPAGDPAPSSEQLYVSSRGQNLRTQKTSEAWLQLKKFLSSEEELDAVKGVSSVSRGAQGNK